MNLSSAYSVLSNVYANYSRASDCFYVYTYRPFYDPEKKRTLKKIFRVLENSVCRWYWNNRI